MEMFLVKWEHFDGCDSHTAPLELFAEQSVAQEFVTGLRLLGMYADQLSSLEGILRSAYTNKRAGLPKICDELFRRAEAACIPREAFGYNATLKIALKLEEPEYPVPRSTDDTYHIEPFQVRTSLQWLTDGKHI